MPPISLSAAKPRCSKNRPCIQNSTSGGRFIKGATVQIRFQRVICRGGGFRDVNHLALLIGVSKNANNTNVSLRQDRSHKCLGIIVSPGCSISYHLSQISGATVGVCGKPYRAQSDCSSSHGHLVRLTVYRKISHTCLSTRSITCDLNFWT